MAQSSGNVSNIVSFGGVDTSSNLTIPEANSQGYFSLFGFASSAGGFWNFYKNGVAYQVTSGKTCMVTSISITPSVSVLNILLASSTATFTPGASTITGGVYQFGGATLYALNGGPTANVTVRYSVPYSFASLTYPCVAANQGGINQIILICKEA
jgi:hypothetical protein